MADIKELDPLFKAPPGQTASNADSGSDLTKLDPIFGNPIGVDPSVSKAAKDVMGAKGSVFGLPRMKNVVLPQLQVPLQGLRYRKLPKKHFLVQRLDNLKPLKSYKKLLSWMR